MGCSDWINAKITHDFRHPFEETRKTLRVSEKQKRRISGQPRARVYIHTTQQIAIVRQNSNKDHEGVRVIKRRYSRRSGTNDPSEETSEFRVHPRARFTSNRLIDPPSIRQRSSNDHEGARETKRKKGKLLRVRASYRRTSESTNES